MKIEIEGNPGTGNTYQEIHIGHVENYNPNATTVNNTYYGTHEKKGEDRGEEVRKKTSLMDIREIPPINEQILAYVSCLSGQVVDEWKGRYMKMWTEILDLDVVSASVYNPGKQQGTNFNRNLVANIIHYLARRGIYGDYRRYNAAQSAIYLEGRSDHSVRMALGEFPPASITSRLDRYFQ